MKMYSVFDKVSKNFNAPFVAENDAVALRSFYHGVKDSPFCDDLELYCVGSFDPADYKNPFVSCDSIFVGVFDGGVDNNG